MLIVSGEKNISYYGSSLSGYISYVNAIPILTDEEEKTLLTDFIKNKNQISGKKIAEAHLRMVVKIAMEFNKYCNNIWDIIAEGNIGLLKALKNFSLEKSVRFSTYAILWIKASIQDFILRSSSNLKISIGQMQKKILFNLNKVKFALNRYSKTQCTTKEIARILEVPEKELIQLTSAISFDADSLDIPNENGQTKAELIAIDVINPEDNFIKNQTSLETKKIIANAFQQLNDREKTIITQRFLSNNQSTLQELSHQLKISIERVRQIESASIKKMKTFLINNIAI